MKGMRLWLDPLIHVLPFTFSPSDLFRSSSSSPSSSPSCSFFSPSSPPSCPAASSSPSSSSSSSSSLQHQQPQLGDLYLVLYFAAAFPVLRFFLDIFVFEKLATWFLKLNGKHSPKDVGKISKTKESLWKLLCYIASEIFIYKFGNEEPWFYKTAEYFKGWPHQEFNSPLKAYYCIQCGFYMYSIFALIVWETRRKDFGVMLSHHIITSVLIGYSYISRFLRIGSMILALHDASDLILELAKLCKYSGRELSASICFGLFAISWFFLRMVYFPFWVIKSSSYNAPKEFDSSNPYHTWIYYSFNTMLIMLLVFHVYWWILICRMVKSQLHNKGKVGDDIRSDSEDD